MHRLSAIFVGLMATGLVAAEPCQSCVSRTVFSSSELRPLLITTSQHDPDVYLLAENLSNGTVQLVRLEIPSGQLTALIDLGERSSLHVADIEADETSIYLLIQREQSQGLFSIEKSGIGFRSITDLRTGIAEIRVDETHVYWTTPPLQQDGVSEPASLQRVPKRGGRVETLVTSRGMMRGEIALDGLDVIFAATPDPSTAEYTLFSLGKDDAAIRSLSKFSSVEAIAIEGSWVYVATGPTIERLSKLGSSRSTVARAVPTHGHTSSIHIISVRAGRIFALEATAVPRGCINNSLFLFHENGGHELLSIRGGVFALGDCAVFHNPADCFLIPAQPPFIVEEHCYPTERRRPVRR